MIYYQGDINIINLTLYSILLIPLKLVNISYNIYTTKKDSLKIYLNFFCLVTSLNKQINLHTNVNLLQWLL